MGLLDKVLGNQEEEAVQNEANPLTVPDETTHPDPPADVAVIAAASDLAPELVSDSEPTQPLPDQPPPDGIRAFDQNGNEVIVPREEWRTNILPSMLRDVWDNPEQLYHLILNSLNDGFFAETADAAHHLSETDTIPARGACMWGIVLTQTGRLDEAESILSTFLADKGEDASVMVNLAKVYAAKGEQERADSLLWRALELEPNLDNGLGWYVSLAQSQAQSSGGDPAAAEAAAREALERIRANPAAWRAQLWLARAELGTGQLDAARALYRESLDRAPKPIPGELLMHMSGDLGGYGLLRDLLEFTAPYFIAELHGLPVGNNLIKACLDTGNIDPAEAIVRQLSDFNRPDWKTALDFWSSEIARARQATGQQAQNQNQDQSQNQPMTQELQIGMLRIDGPIWLPTNSPAKPLFGTKQAAGPSVTFLGGTAEAPPVPAGAPPQMADPIGRMTRALPLFLAEQVDLLGAATGRAMLPWAVSQTPGQTAGFVVSGQAWPDQVAVQSVSGAPNQSDYVVTVHVDAEVEPWTADLAFIRSSDGVRIGELTRDFDPAAPAEGILALATEVLELLGEAEILDGQIAYEVPDEADFASYLARLEQLLAVRCAGMNGVPATFLTGEHEILSSEIALCRAEPENIAVRLLLVETIAGMRGIRPEIAAEFLPALQSLEAEQPLPILSAAFA